MVRQAARDIEQPIFPGCAVVGDGGLDEVSGAVHLVEVAQVGPAFRFVFEHEVGVEIPVRLLRIGYLVDHDIDHAREVWASSVASVHAAPSSHLYTSESLK
jgi:hypothetical protein